MVTAVELVVKEASFNRIVLDVLEELEEVPLVVKVVVVNKNIINVV